MCSIVIQGTIEAGGKLTKAEIAQSVIFCTSVIAKVDSGCLSTRLWMRTNPVVRGELLLQPVEMIGVMRRL